MSLDSLCLHRCICPHIVQYDSQTILTWRSVLVHTNMTWHIYLSCTYSSHAVVDNWASKMGTPESASTIQTHMTLNRGYGQYVELTGTRDIWDLVFNTTAPTGFCRLYRLHNNEMLEEAQKTKKMPKASHIFNIQALKITFQRGVGGGQTFHPKSWQTE